KRVAFLREVVAALDLKRVEILDRKIYASFSRPVEGVITRALEAIPKTLARAKRCLVPGGWAIFMKGPRCDGEVREASDRFGDTYRLIRDIPYTIPYSTHRRRLVIFERLE
ncbi:MAG: class I SAM-dependent methyltransferase, partial [Deltaproteobacteria bacterium]|nr:class I SAM-dependent methyltransferase [Deltaproteobacteria bacterium]